MLFFGFSQFLHVSLNPPPAGLTLEVINKSPSAESNNLLYGLHRGEDPEKGSIRWIQVEFTLLNSSGQHSGVGDDVVFFSRGGLDMVDELV